MINDHSSRGVISLLALIIMAAVTATALAAAAIVIAELRQTENLDQSITAVYAAESGLEDGLYIIKANRTSLPLDTVKNTLLAEGSGVNRVDLSTGATWSRSAELENRYIIPRLSADETVNLDIFNPDNPAQTSIQSLWVNWSWHCTSASAYVEMNTTMLTWDKTPQGFVSFDPATQHIYKVTTACNPLPSSPERCQDIKLTDVGGSQITPGKPYRFSFRLLVPGDTNTCTADNVVITAYSDQYPWTIPQSADRHPISLPTTIQIKSVGSFARSQQALTASVPWRAPISGLLGFVLFSEEPVSK
ncbi:MAG: hypothetical protein V1778_04265 [bacterium]